MPEEESIDIKFRLYDGSDIGPFRYSAASTVDFLKQRVVSDWPKGLFMDFEVFSLFRDRCYFSPIYNWFSRNSS